MNNKLLSYLIAGALGTTLVLASPALAFHGGGGGGGGGGMGGGMHAGGGMGGGTAVGGMSAGARFGAMSGSPAFSGGHSTSMAFAHPGFAPRSSTFRSSTFADRDHFGHHRFHRFAVGVPFGYAAYDSCWRRVWTPYGLRWVDVCNDYGY